MQDDRYPDQFRWFETLGMGPILPSRAPALAGLTDTWAAGGSEIRVLTGAPGAGKSWLWRQAVEHTRNLRDDLRWAWIPHWPGARGTDLFRSLLGTIEDSGISERMSLERMFVRAERRIRELREDGFGLRIVVEESHHLEYASFESIRILCERLRPVGIDLAVLFVGRTTTLRKVRRVTGEPSPLGWHLPHISIGETLDLLKWFGGEEKSWTRAEADWIHREALGNPRRVIRWAESIPGTTEKPDKPMIKPGFGTGSPGTKPSAPGVSLLTEPLIPTRPPLAESEGIIEVGYADDDPSPHYGFMGDDTDDSAWPEENPERTEPAKKSTRIRMEQGESFSPYGLGIPRFESAPEKPSE